MTREEASFYLTNMDRKYMEEGMSEALDMAIKALEPCEDAISKDAILDYVFHCKASLYDDIKEILDNIPSATPTRTQ